MTLAQLVGRRFCVGPPREVGKSGWWECGCCYHEAPDYSYQYEPCVKSPAPRWLLNLLKWSA